MAGGYLRLEILVFYFNGLYLKNCVLVDGIIASPGYPPRPGFTSWFSRIIEIPFEEPRGVGARSTRGPTRYDFAKAGVGTTRRTAPPQPELGIRLTTDGLRDEMPACGTRQGSSAGESARFIIARSGVRSPLLLLFDSIPPPIPAYGRPACTRSGVSRGMRPENRKSGMSTALSLDLDPVGI
jgi:hypothetical protein